MSNLVFGIVATFVLGFGLTSTIMSCHMSYLVYEKNVRLIPTGNSNCLRLLPQISGLNNLDDPASYLIFSH
jgi:hypothetical protein